MPSSWRAARCTPAPTTREALGKALTTVRAEGTVTSNNGFSPSHGPLKPAQVETMLGEGFVPVD